LPSGMIAFSFFFRPLFVTDLKNKRGKYFDGC
jgi:hypothetical protein